MRLSTNERMRYVKDNYNHNPAYKYAFTIRGQVYGFQTRDEYLEAFGRAPEIAKEQERRMEQRQDCQMDIEEALEDSGQEKQYELNFESGHLSSGDECTCGSCIETERDVENR